MSSRNCLKNEPPRSFSWMSDSAVDPGGEEDCDHRRSPLCGNRTPYGLWAHSGCLRDSNRHLLSELPHPGGEPRSTSQDNLQRTPCVRERLHHSTNWAGARCRVRRGRAEGASNRVALRTPRASDRGRGRRIARQFHRQIVRFSVCPVSALERVNPDLIN